MNTEQEPEVEPEEPQNEEPQEQVEEPAEAPPEEPGEEPAEPEEAKAGEEPGEEGGEAAPKAGEEAKAEEAKKPRRAGGWERKIERLERQNQMLMEQVIQRQGPPQGQPGKEPTPEEKATAYIDSLVEQRMAAREAQTRQAHAQQEFQKRTEEVRAAHPDFDDVVQGVEHVPVPPALQQALLTSSVGPEIMYQLASNPAELARIAALPPYDAFREIGRLEAKASSTAAPTPKTAPRSAARPPAPPTNVGGTKAPTRSLDDLPLAEYKRAYRSGRR